MRIRLKQNTSGKVSGSLKYSFIDLFERNLAAHKLLQLNLLVLNPQSFLLLLCNQRE